MVKEDDDKLGWTILFSNGVEVHIDIRTWEIDCMHDDIRKSVKEAICSVIDYLSSLVFLSETCRMELTTVIQYFDNMYCML